MEIIFHLANEEILNQGPASVKTKHSTLGGKTPKRFVNALQRRVIRAIHSPFRASSSQNNQPLSDYPYNRLDDLLANHFRLLRASTVDEY
jgi:hypothetical protein